MRAAAAVALLTIALSAQPRAPDPARHLAGVTGTFVMLDAAANRYVRLNPARAAQRFPPCSTFKIPNTLIALQSGVAADANHFVKYDPALKLEGQGPTGAWGRDHTLRSAFANSVVWYYQEIARRVGDARMSAFLRQFDYGDRDMSGGLDRFWLGTLRIWLTDDTPDQGRTMAWLDRRLRQAGRLAALLPGGRSGPSPEARGEAAE